MHITIQTPKKIKSCANPNTKLIMCRRLSDLPPKMVENILLKLPIKSLLRFKSVSKSWNAIVSDPIFVRNHYHHQSNSHNLFLRRRSYDTDGGLALVRLEDGKLQTINIIEHPLIVPPSCYDDCLCFCEYGVLLVTNNSHSERCILWNPSARKTTKLSLPHGLNTCYSGICYDPAIDDFKVVVVHYDFYAVYSCKNKSWSDRKQHPYNVASDQPGHNSSGVSINGAIYWILDNTKNSCAEIIGYDPRDDKLKILQKPEDVQVDQFNSYLLDLGGHLSLYCYSCESGLELDKTHIWRKGKGIDETSWKELITVDHNVDLPISSLHPLRFVGNKVVLLQYKDHDGDKLAVVDLPIWSLHPLCSVGNRVVLQYKDRDGDKLVVYNPHEKTFEKLEGKLIGMGSLIPYRDTLFLT